MRPQTYLGMALAVANLAVTLYIYPKVKEYLAVLGDGKPFGSQISQKLHKIVFAVLVGGALCAIIKFAEELVSYRLLHMEIAFLNENVASCVFKADPSIGLIFSFIGLMLLSWIFRYGEQLQVALEESGRWEETYHFIIVMEHILENYTWGAIKREVKIWMYYASLLELS